MDTLPLNVPDNRMPAEVIEDGVISIPTAELDRLESGIGVSLKNILSSEFIMPTNFKWFVMRASYGKNTKAFEVFQQHDIFSYIPYETVLKRDMSGNKKRVRKPIFSNYIFVLATEKDAKLFVGKSGCKQSLNYLDFSYDHTQQNEYGRDLRMTIPHSVMVNFIRLAEFDTYKVHTVDINEIRFVSDVPVRIIDGVFKGITGRVARVHNQTTVVVTLDNVVSMTTAYIPKHFMVPIDESTKNM